MTTAFEDDTYEDDEPTAEQTQRESHDIKRLREKAAKAETEAKRAEEAEARAVAAERKLALREAGIDLGTPLGRLFAKSYDGDPTPEAVRAAAEAEGVLEPETTVSDDEEAAHDRIRSASTGAGASGSHQITPADAAAWSPSQWERFANANPEKADLLKQGKPVDA